MADVAAGGLWTGVQLQEAWTGLLADSAFLNLLWIPKVDASEDDDDDTPLSKFGTPKAEPVVSKEEQEKRDRDGEFLKESLTDPKRPQENLLNFLVTNGLINPTFNNGKQIIRYLASDGKELTAIGRNYIATLNNVQELSFMDSPETKTRAAQTGSKRPEWVYYMTGMKTGESKEYKFDPAPDDVKKYVREKLAMWLTDMPEGPPLGGGGGGGIRRWLSHGPNGGGSGGVTPPPAPEAPPAPAPEAPPAPALAEEPTPAPTPTPGGAAVLVEEPTPAPTPTPGGAPAAAVDGDDGDQRVLDGSGADDSAEPEPPVLEAPVVVDAAPNAAEDLEEALITRMQNMVSWTDNQLQDLRGRTRTTGLLTKARKERLLKEIEKEEFRTEMEITFPELYTELTKAPAVPQKGGAGDAVSVNTVSGTAMEGRKTRSSGPVQVDQKGEEQDTGTSGGAKV